MVAAAATLAGVVIFQNFRNAGLLWGAVVTAAQSLIVIAVGPLFAAMLALFIFRSMTKGTGNGGGSGAVNATPAPQPNSGRSRIRVKTGHKELLGAGFIA